MDIVVHRQYPWQLGGCVTEICADTTRIFIDFGVDLPCGGVTGDAPRLQGLNVGTTPRCDAVFFTHYHLDHIGAIAEILPGIPLYMGQTATAIFRNACLHHAQGMLPAAQRIQGLTPLVPVRVGDIVVTPIPCDHSAYDSMMYLVEHGGKKVLHTGDFRMHGFMGKATPKLIRKYVGTVDALLMEGTNLGNTQPAVTEHALQQRIRQVVSDHPYVFVLCSSSHIQRLASFCNATPRGRYFVCDAYQRSVFDIVCSTAFSQWFRFRKALVWGDNLRLRERGFVMLFRASDPFEKLMAPYVEEAVLIYSMWGGYLEHEDGKMARFTAPFRKANRMIPLHTSGHADVEGLRQMVQLVAPEVVIPLHSELPEQMACMVPEHMLAYAPHGEPVRL